ncbi:hypothetical protein CERZMDRAFT_91435 [Cercospora zeae-maydis SCOH1-5]|uniref:Uncharacterized protein n=1 Tax=Cercospora zeae-maydis SCOH1-5 TaxID=717836 RepID=A0A6A6F6W4_9PEZI|nr:hypothetical protein CERZMDRAFT_91435 [Cercospora zeae-maydis SCOH1-5]
MAAPRATQFIALRNLTRGAQQVRQLSITGPKTYASPILERPVFNPPAIAKTERPTVEQDSKLNPATRHFNTSRERKSVKDTSTIDFAYLPDLMAPPNVDIYAQVRVPIIPTGAQAAPKVIESETVVMKPEINVMSADAVYLPMSESSDGHAMNIDFHAMAEKVAANLRRMRAPVEQQAGIAKQIWGDMIDDVMGLKKGRTAA